MNYLYETIPAREGDKVKQFEIKQSANEVSLTKHPETGEPVPAGHTYVIGVLGNKKKWYEIDSQSLNKLSNEDLQKELFKILHPQTHH